MSWINWTYGIRDLMLLQQRLLEEEQILRETWKRQHTPKDESLDIPPDYDEAKDLGGPVLFTMSELLMRDLIPRTIHSSITKKVRVPIPKAVRVRLVRERGDLCQNCQNEVIQHWHHINNNPSDGSESNLQGLCYECHKMKHQ